MLGLGSTLNSPLPFSVEHSLCTLTGFLSTVNFHMCSKKKKSKKDMFLPHSPPTALVQSQQKPYSP